MYGTLPATSWLRIRPSGLIYPIMFIILFASSTSCTNFGLGNDSVTTDPAPSPAATPISSPSNTTVPQSVLPVRQQGDSGQVTGSAVIISEDGFLLTSLDVVDDSMEVVLPDGRTHRPALVSTDQVHQLAMLKIPETGLEPVVPSGERPGNGSEVFATGFDSSPEDPARISGTVAGTEEPEPDVNYRVRGTLIYQTDMNLIPGFSGGALTDTEGNFCGILIPGSSSNDDAVFRAVSQWYVIAWLEDRDRRMTDLQEQSQSWQSITLPGGWSINHPDDWTISVQANSDDRFRAELSPSDPDVPLQFAISVEENQYGIDPDAFADDVFSGRDSARIWSVGEIDRRSHVQATIAQEGALVDVAYVLDEDYLIAISLTSGYQPDADQTQVDQARALFETVVQSLESTS